MKNTYLSLTSAIAVFFLSLGFVRFAGSFDHIGAGQQAAELSGVPSPNCTSSCPCPDARFLA